MKSKHRSVNKIILIANLAFFGIIICIVVVNKVFGECTDCDGCKYQHFSETVYISSYELDKNDSVALVSFSVKGQKPKTSMVLDRARFDTLRIDLSTVDKVNNQSIYFKLSGKKRVQGTCEPYILEKISRKK